MPTVLRKDSFMSFFNANENDRPMHIHVEKGNADGKIWLKPTAEIAYMYGFSNAELKQIAAIVFEFSGQFKSKWNEHFGK